MDSDVPLASKTIACQVYTSPEIEEVSHEGAREATTPDGQEARESSDYKGLGSVLEKVGISALILIVWVLLLLPIIFYHLPVVSYFIDTMVIYTKFRVLVVTEDPSLIMLTVLLRCLINTLDTVLMFVCA